MNKHIYNFLRNPIVVFASMGVGVLLGIYFPGFSTKIKGIGEIYLVVINMTVLPILVSAIISSVGNFVQHPVLYKLTFYALKVISITMIAIVGLSLFAGFVFKPGVLPVEESQVLSEYIGKESNIFEFALHDSEELVQEDGFIITFLKILIPVNIFAAFIDNNALALAFVSIILGISAGLLSFSQSRNRKDDKSQSFISANLLIDFFDSLFKVFQVIIKWTLTFIPIALISIISSQVAGFGFDIINTTLRLIILFYILGCVLILANSTVTGYLSGNGVLNTLKASLYPTLIGFTTKNSIAAIPSSIRLLSTNLKLDRSLSQLLVPLCIILCRYGNLVWFALVSVFATQIYGINPGVMDIIVLMIGLILSVVATAGSSGFATLGIIAIPLIPLGIPVETILLILYAIDPIVDPLRSALIVQTNFCTASLICSKKQTESQTGDALEVEFSHNNIEIVAEK